VDSARRVDTWRHGGGLYLEHIAAAKLTSGHGQKRRTLLLIKRKPILKISVGDMEETAQQQHATRITRSRESREVAGLAVGGRTRSRVERAKNPGGVA
jgi:hypothetical protein